MFASILRPLALVALIAMPAAPVTAQSLSDIVSVELLPGWRTEGGSHMAAIRVKLSQGWKTYWRSPGDAGIPPEFNWGGSQNIKAVQVHWPAPQVFDFNGMQSIGYAREVVLPVEIWPASADQPVRLEAALDMGVCRDICVPASMQLAGALLPNTRKSDPAIRAALKAQPGSARAAGLRAHRCQVEAAGRGLRLTAELDMPRLGPDEIVVIEAADPGIWVSESRTRREGGRLVAQVDMQAANRQPFGLDRSRLVLTVLAGGKAVEVTGCPSP